MLNECKRTRNFDASSKSGNCRTQSNYKVNVHIETYEMGSQVYHPQLHVQKPVKAILGIFLNILIRTRLINSKIHFKILYTL